MKRFPFILFLSISFNHLLPLPIFSQIPSHDKKAVDDPLFVYIHQEMVRPPGDMYLFQRGAPSRITFVIKNRSDKFIVVRNVNVIDQLPDIERWYGASYGSLEYRPLEDIWIHNELIQILSRPICTKGVIPPGGSLKAVRWGVLKKDQTDLEITYQGLSREEVQKNMYFFIHRKEEASPFKRIYRRPQEIHSLLKAEVDWSLVIFPQADRFQSHKQKLSCKVTLREPDFGLDEAKSKIEGQVSDFIFWKNRNSWVLNTEKGSFLVEKDRISSLPEIDLLAFILLESSKEAHFILPLEGYEPFNPQKPKIEGPGYFNPGITPIPKERILHLFEHAKVRGDTISVFPYDPQGLGGQFYLLVGVFDERLRRDLAGK